MQVHEENTNADVSAQASLSVEDLIGDIPPPAKKAPVKRFKLYAPKLFDAGYLVIPVGRASKIPTLKAWGEKGASAVAEDVEGWADEFDVCGVGVLTKHTPAVDIDVLDAPLSEEINRLAAEKLGWAPVRIGQAPKQLRVYRTDAPFGKIKTNTYRLPDDPEGFKGHAVEILADGQYFVASGIHPETRRLYRYEGKSLDGVPAAELTLITEVQALQFVDICNEMFEARGGIKTSSGGASGEGGQRTARPPMGVSLDMARLALDTYHNGGHGVHWDDWFYTLMALKHEFGPNGYELAMDWSARSEKDIPGNTEAIWEAIDPRGELTIRSLFRHARMVDPLWMLEDLRGLDWSACEALEAEVKARRPPPPPPPPTWNEIKERACGLAKNAASDEVSAVLNMAARGDLSAMQRDELLEDIKRTTGRPKGPVKEELLRAERKHRIDAGATRKEPEWVRRYVYVAKDNAFHDIRSGGFIERSAFNLINASKVPTKDDGSIQPADFYFASVASNRLADQACYTPGARRFIVERGQRLLNLYTAPDITAAAGDVGPFLHNLENFFEGEPAGLEWLLGWAGFLMANPGVKIRSAPLLISPNEGTGKGLFVEALRCVLGVQNVCIFDNRLLKSQFTDWLEKAQLIYIPEMLMGKDEMAMNSLKSPLTDPYVSIHPKGRAAYQQRNIFNFCFSSNHKRAARLEPGDRRFMVHTSEAGRMDTGRRDEYLAWLKAPQTPGALLHWARTQAPKFDPDGAPPDTAAKAEAVEESMNHAERLIMGAVESGSGIFGRDVVTVSQVIEEVHTRWRREVSPHMVGKALRAAGGVSVGQKRLGDGTRPRCWVLRNLDKWSKESEIAIAAYIDGQKSF